MTQVHSKSATAREVKDRTKLPPRSASLLLLLIAAFGVALAAVPFAGYSSKFPAWTSSGLTFGHLASDRTAVTEFLGIPYGQRPSGNLRFAAPQPYRSRLPFNAASYSPDCPAVVPSASIAQSNITMASEQGIRIFDDVNRLGHTTSEDCLKLNIWTKRQPGNLKPVLVRIPGGAFQTQTTNSSFLYHGEFLADYNDVVVVTVNYRVNIFGFPGLPVTDKNIGLLDQRLAVEWVRDNIGAFGGDPTRITLFGESTGGTSIDFYSFAYKDDPIVAGLIAESGTSVSLSNPAAGDNIALFNTIASAVNCPNASAMESASALQCMRTKPVNDIIAAYSASGLQFNPTADNSTVFADYLQRANHGAFARIPMLLGNNDYEAGIIRIFLKQRGSSLSDEQAALLNLRTFSCPVGAIAGAKAKHIPLWRYRYYGDFPNTRLTLDPGSGAWHGAEIPMVFGTAEGSGQANTAAEAEIIRYVMGAWTSFARDPHHGLEQAPYGLPRYGYDELTLIRLAYKNETMASFVYPVTYDFACGPFVTPEGPDQAALAGVANLTSLGGGSEVGY